MAPEKLTQLTCPSDTKLTEHVTPRLFGRNPPEQSKFSAERSLWALEEEALCCDVL